MPKRVLTGTVVSDKGDKTVVIRVERRVKHPLYGKIIKLSKKYHAHDAANEFRAGEIVRIEECAPISKLKTWTVLDRIGTAKAAVVEITEPEALTTPETEAAKPEAKKPEDKKPEAKAEKKPAVKKPAKKTKTKDVADADA
jgi:small subunit ribosomal protein S17